MMADESSPRPAIGGFFALHEADGAADEPSILEHWTSGRQFTCFVNARSAFAALVSLLSPPRVWLPAFLCKSLSLPPGSEVRFYPVGDDFSPDVAVLEERAGPRDLVLAVDYFGFQPAAPFLDFVARRRDLSFVEDRAQSLDPAAEPWGDWCLYSPRKLLGVADGGILVAERNELPLPRPDKAPDATALWTAPLLRYEDPQEADNASWYSAHRAKEDAMSCSTERMTRLSRRILSRTAIKPLADARRRNWRVLDSVLGLWLAAKPRPAEAVPFGYVLSVPADRHGEFLRQLHAERIFAAVHWATLPSPAGEFPREHTWTTRLVTLPCDHRYDDAAMQRIARRVIELLA